MTLHKASAFAACIAGIAVTGVALKRTWIDATSGAALITCAAYVLGRLQTELFAPPKYGRRATDPPIPAPTPPRDDEVPPTVTP